MYAVNTFVNTFIFENKSTKAGFQPTFDGVSWRSNHPPVLNKNILLTDELLIFRLV